MAVLPILTRDQHHGTVFVEDTRADGTVVVLRCAEGNQGGGVAAQSHKPNTVWPMFLKRGRGRALLNRVVSSDFVLTFDTSKLPQGRLEFEISPFIEQVQRAVESGQAVVSLDQDDALKWGLRLEEVR